MTKEKKEILQLFSKNSGKSIYYKIKKLKYEKSFINKSFISDLIEIVEKAELKGVHNGQGNN